MSFIKLIKRLWCILSMILMIGCATYEPRNNSQKFTEDNILKNETVGYAEPLEVHIVVFIGQEVAKNYVGINPKKSNMLPVFMKILNNGNDVIKIDLQRSFLLAKSGENYQSLTLEESIKRAERSDAEVVGWTIGFGLVGALISGDKAASANKSLEEDYHNKFFKPTLINNKSSAQGILFFDVPKEKQPDINSVLIQALNINTNEVKKISLKLPENNSK